MTQTVFKGHLGRGMSGVEKEKNIFKKAQHVSEV